MKMVTIKTFLPLKLSHVMFIVLINFKMPTFVDILPFMSIINMLI